MGLQAACGPTRRLRSAFPLAAWQLLLHAGFSSPLLSHSRARGAPCRAERGPGVQVAPRHGGRWPELSACAGYAALRQPHRCSSACKPEERGRCGSLSRPCPSLCFPNATSPTMAKANRGRTCFRIPEHVPRHGRLRSRGSSSQNCSF